MILLFSLIWMALQLTSTSALARPESEYPYHLFKYGRIGGLQTAGYGFIGGTGSPNSDGVDFSCTMKDKNRFLKEARECYADAAKPKSSDGTQLMHDVFYPMLLEKTRAELFEYYALKYAVAHPDERPLKLELPACLAGTEEGKRLQAVLDVTPRNFMPSGGYASMSPAEKHRYLKYAAILEENSAQQMSKAVLLEDRLGYELKSKCEKTATPQCRDLKVKFQRLQTQGVLARATEGTKAKIRSGFQALIGLADKNPTSGEKLYNKLVYSDDLLEPIETRLGGLYDELLDKRIDHARHKQIKDVLDALDAKTADVRKDQEPYLEILRKEVCSKSALFYGAINHPNVVRQVFNQMSRPEKAAASYTLCRFDLLNYFQAETSCSPTFRRKDFGGPINVSNSYGFQFQYQLIPNGSYPDEKGPPAIKLVVKVKNATNKSDAEVDKMLKHWGDVATAWYNGQAERINPGHPAAKFDITLVRHSGWSIPNAMATLHACYNVNEPEDKRTDCKLGRAKQLANCKAACAGSGKPKEQSITACLAKCDAEAAAGKSYTRETSQDFTLQTEDSTMIHELGHHLGLDDEYGDYFSDRRRYQEGGEDDSVMRSHEGAGDKEPKLYPRHLKQLLAPLECLDK